MAKANYFIPPELRKHVQLIKELPEIVADTVTDPDTYAALNELLNPVKWIESAGQKSGKFFESGGKDIESGAEALIETLGLAAGPMAQKYASTLAPMVSRGVGSGVKSLQELVMPFGATDDVAKKVPQKKRISRRDFIAGGTALGTLAGLKQAGDFLPPTKGIKTAAKTPLASTIKALNSVKSNYKKVRNEQKLIDESILRLKTKNQYAVKTLKEKIEIKKLEKIYDTAEMKVIKSADSMEEKISSLVSSLLKQSKKDLIRLNDDQLKSLRGHLIDDYYYSGFINTKYVKFAPSDEASILSKPVDPKNFFKSDLADKTRMGKLSSSKESSEKTDYEKIVLRVDEVLEERGLTTIKDVNKIKTLVGKIPSVNRYVEKLDAEKLPFSSAADYNQGGLTTDEQTQQAFNKGGITVEQQMSLFEEGGMKDDGLKKDPVSGNDIPPGSLAKEVRDDIPAQLSDGEYVVPADVVQYFGVKFFEDIRMEAKSGLKQMDETGRIGGEPVSMTMIALGEAEEKKKKAEGGPVGYSNGGMSEDQKKIQASKPSFNPVDYAVLGFTPVSPVAQTGQTSQEGVTRTVTYYHGETGESRVVTFIGGVVTPPTDLQYTQPPWSTNKPVPTEVKQQREDRDESKDAPPGWGSDPKQFDFTGFGQEEWDNEVDSLLNPKGPLDKTIGQLGFFKATSVANAYAAIALAEAKGMDTTEMKKKAQVAFDDLGFSGKAIVTGTNKLLGTPDEYAETVGYYNKSYANSPTGKPTTASDNVLPPTTLDDERKNESTITGKTYVNEDGGTSKTEDFGKGRVTTVKTKSDTNYAAKEKFEKSKKSAESLAKANKDFSKESGIKDSEDYYVGNKGGLLQKPKRKKK